MKKIMMIALALVASASLCQISAAKKKKVTVPTAPAVKPVELKNSSDSVSYSGGMTMTQGLIPFLQQQGMDTTYMADFIRGFKEFLASNGDSRQLAYAKGMEIAKQMQDRMLPSMSRDFTDTPDSIVSDILFRGFTDALEGDTTVFTDEAAQTYFRARLQANQQAKDEKLYGETRRAGKAFLEENSKKEGVISLPSGLQYKVLVKGEGEVPLATDKVKVNYEGRLIDGTVFDASAKHGDKPAEFTPNHVIKGWTEALTMMPVGSKWQLYIPYELAYGERGAGEQIKPYSTLVFDLELVEITK